MVVKYLEVAMSRDESLDDFIDAIFRMAKSIDNEPHIKIFAYNTYFNFYKYEITKNPQKIRETIARHGCDFISRKIFI